MGTVNWGKLYEQGRCKAIGIPWSQEEREAIYLLKIPVEYVREGVLTLKAFEAAKEIKIETKKELMVEAKALGIKFTPEVMIDTLKAEIEAKKEAIRTEKAEKAKVKAKEKAEAKAEKDKEAAKVKSEKAKAKKVVKKVVKKKK